MTITPDQADRLKRDATDGPWMLDQQDPDEVPMIMSMRVENGLVIGAYIAECVEKDGDARLIAAAPDLAQTIAGMREEWAVEMYHDVDDTWRQYTTWVATREGASQHLAVDGYRWGQNYRLVRRLVGPVEVTE